MALIGTFGAAVREADAEREPDTFAFYGETFEVAGRVGAMPLLRFAAVADSGAQAEEMEGLVAMHELLRDCLVPGDWPRFQKVAADNKADAEELMEVCGAIYQVVSGYPTQQPSASTAGLSTTGESLKANSSSEVSSIPGEEWRTTPLGQRELAANPAAYANVKPINQAGLAALAG